MMSAKLHRVENIQDRDDLSEQHFYKKKARD